MTYTTAVVKLAMKVDQRISTCLDDQSRKANRLHNTVLEKAYEALDEFKKTGNKEVARKVFGKYGLRNLVPKIKDQHPFLKSVHSSPLKNAALRATNSFKSYFDSKHKRRKGPSIQRPRFSSWKRKWFSLLYDEPNNGFKVIGSTLRLSLGTGIERKRHHLSIPLIGVKALKGKTIRNLRIVKE